jgi:four helix bundle protein
MSNMTLRIQGEVIELVRRTRAAVEAIGKHDKDLERQVRRAMTSVVLNGREGERQGRGKGRQRFEDAMGSADEVKGGLEVAEALGYVEVEAQIVAEWTRVARVFWKLRG